MSEIFLNRKNVRTFYKRVIKNNGFITIAYDSLGEQFRIDQNFCNVGTRS